MNLLILKSGTSYIRVREKQFLLVGLDKASVFPMDQITRVRKYETRLKILGFESVIIKKLILSEEDL